VFRAIFPSLLLSLAIIPFPLLAENKTENIIFLMTDGFRTQELFGGAEASLITKETAGSSGVDAIKQAYWRDTPAARREALLPFLWGTMARAGRFTETANSTRRQL